MGYILEQTDEMHPYNVEVRRESFYLYGSPNFIWSRIDPETNERVFWDDDERPEGPGWDCGYHKRRHSIVTYENGDTGQGTAEILIEDIPKIRAALDEIEAYLERTRGTHG